MIRDLSNRQFRAALKRHGMTEGGVMGYVDLGIPGQWVSVSKWNAGTNRRDQLAYLLRARERYEKEAEKLRAIAAAHEGNSQ